MPFNYYFVISSGYSLSSILCLQLLHNEHGSGLTAAGFYILNILSYGLDATKQCPCTQSPLLIFNLTKTGKYLVLQKRYSQNALLHCSSKDIFQCK